MSSFIIEVPKLLDTEAIRIIGQRFLVSSKIAAVNA